MPVGSGGRPMWEVTFKASPWKKTLAVTRQYTCRRSLCVLFQKAPAFRNKLENYLVVPVHLLTVLGPRMNIGKKSMVLTASVHIILKYEAKLPRTSIYRDVPTLMKTKTNY